jgi:hypothetical protein
MPVEVPVLRVLFFQIPPDSDTVTEAELSTSSCGGLHTRRVVRRLVTDIGSMSASLGELCEMTWTAVLQGQ